MATQQIPVSKNGGSSGDVTVVAGTPLLLAINVDVNASPPQVPAGAIVDIYYKDAAAFYSKIGVFTGAEGGGVLTGPGTYKFVKPHSSDVAWGLSTG